MPASEIVHQLQSLVSLNDDLFQGTGHLVLFQVRCASIRVHFKYLAFKGTGERNHDSASIIGIDPLLQLEQPKFG